jgi:hypothetical protein
MRYTLLVLGPDNRSTYSECWGATATSDGRPVATAARLADLAEPAGKLGHTNWAVRDGRRYITPEEFWQRPAVAAVVAAREEPANA